MTRSTHPSLYETTAHLGQALAYQEILLEPDFDPLLDDLEREFAELRLAINHDLN